MASPEMAAQVIVLPDDDDCTPHPGNKYAIICLTCNGKLICLKCVTTSHLGHTFGDLQEKLLKSKEEVISFINFVEKTYFKQKRLNKDTLKNPKTELSVSKERAVAIRAIQQRCDDVKTQMDAYKEKLVSLANNIADTNRNNIEKTTVHLEKECEEFDSFKKTIQDIIDTGKLIKLLHLQEKKESLIASLDDPSEQMPFLRGIKFTSAEAKEQQLQHIFGHLGKLPDRAPDTVKKKTQTLDNVTSIHVVSKERAWICINGVMKLLDR